MVTYRIIDVKKELCREDLFLMLSESWNNPALTMPILAQPFPCTDDYIILPASYHYVVIAYSTKNLYTGQDLIILSLCKAQHSVFTFLDSMLTEQHYVKELIEVSKNVTDEDKKIAVAERAIEVYYQEIIKILASNGLI